MDKSSMQRAGWRGAAAVAVPSISAMLALAACGGGGGGSFPFFSTAPASSPAPATVTMKSTVIDGPLLNAVVCLDLNQNGVCDPNEPQGTSDAQGNVTLTINQSDAGKFPLVAMVGTTATDAASGPVPTAYVLQAPADATDVISPLTTLVQSQIAGFGGTSAEAASIIQSALGLNTSPLSNYLTTPNANAANLARMLVLFTQQQTTSLAPDIGMTDSSGATVSTTDLQNAIAQSLLNSLPALAAAAADPSVTNAATPGAVDAALAAEVNTLINTGQAGYTPSTALVAIGINKLPADVSAATPAPVANLRMLTFADTNNWSFRAMEATTADDTPDASGLIHYYDNHTQEVAGASTSWGFQNSAARQGDLHWNGTAWTGCPLGFRNSQMPRDSNGRTTYNYCDSYETGISKRSGSDISGKAMTDVIATIRSTPGSDSNVAFAKFGPTDLTKLGGGTFPAGSTLWYYTNQPLTDAMAYITNPTAGDVQNWSAAVSAGNSTACHALTGTNSSQFESLATTLESMIASNPGTPCVYGQQTDSFGTSSAVNEWWGASSINLGTIAGGEASPPSAFYTNLERLQVSFSAGGSGVTFLSCLDRALNSTPLNCTSIGTGTYSIQSIGDARVLTFNNPPSEVVRLGYSRIFVERGGQVYYGYQVLAGTKLSVRLNLPAANAMFAQLGIPQLVPN